MKLDENLGRMLKTMLIDGGHDAKTVPEQNLYSTADVQLIEICHRERRCLVTLDLDFANPLRFPPEHFSGIIVLRLPHKPEPDHLKTCVETLQIHLKNNDAKGQLWIVEPGRIREYRPDPE